MTRPYLKTDDRRQHLLDAASRLFVRDGYSGMTMVALAAEAGVSRRLVYDHFPDLPSLYAAFFDDRASRYLSAIAGAVATADDAASAFAGAFSVLLAMPAEDQRAVRLLVADPGLPDLHPLRERFRGHVEQQWLWRLGDVDVQRSRAALWTLVSGLFGLAELVSRGEATPEVAMSVATGLVASMQPTWSGGPAPTTQRDKEH